jgi:hypothetical protein
MLAATLDAINRRTSPRFDVVLPVVADGRSGSSSNLSEGGACIELEGRAPKIGESIEVQFDVPGSEPVKVEAEVRWAKPGLRSTCGVMFRKGHQKLVALLVAGVIGGASADASAAATTTVPTFDPNADVVMDMEAGPEQPNSHTVQEAFSRQYDAIDACVVERKGDSDRTLEGEAHVEVLLNPKGATPLGVNTVLPGKTKKDRELVECLRAAVATADYPSYDGPPVVVEFDFELDPGFEEVPEE